MSTRPIHPDFEAAPEELRWSGRLPELFETLRHQAYKLKGEEAWRILPGGAGVGLRILPETFTKQLRIVRRLRKAFSDKSATAWHTEIRTFLEQFGCKAWICKRDGLIEGEPVKIETVYEEPGPLGAQATMLTCARCFKPFTPGPNDRIYATPICNSCAMKFGTEFANEKRRERAVREPCTDVHRVVNGVCENCGAAFPA